jgi:hypothetical protein
VARLLESEGITREPCRPATTVLPQIFERRRQGKSNAEIGQVLGYSWQAICRALKRAANHEPAWKKLSLGQAAASFLSVAGPGFLAQALCGVYGPDTIQPLLERRRDRRCTTSLLLPQMIELRSQGLSSPKIAQRLGLTTRQVEHVMVWHRKHYMDGRL